MKASGCKFADVKSDVLRLHRLYWVYLGDRPRSNLLDLPWWMREVAEMVDFYRAEALRRERDEQKDKRERQKMMKKAGIPL